MNLLIDNKRKKSNNEQCQHEREPRRTASGYKSAKHIFRPFFPLFVPAYFF